MPMRGSKIAWFIIYYIYLSIKVLIINLEIKVNKTTSFNQNKKRYIHNNQQYFRIDNCDKFTYQQYKEETEKNSSLEAIVQL